MSRKSAQQSVDVAIAGFMASHDGVASRCELLALGLGGDAISKRSRNGRLHRVHQGVYALHSSLTSLARTLLDLAEVVPQRILIAALDRAEDLRILDLRDIRAVLTANPHRHGAAKLTKAIAEYAQEPVLRSILERDFLALCRKHELPTPHANRTLGPHEADFHWPEQRLIVETDGRAHHARRKAFTKDRVRDAELLAQGWRTVRFTYAQVLHEPKWVAGILRRALTREARA